MASTNPHGKAAKCQYTASRSEFLRRGGWKNLGKVFDKYAKYYDLLYMDKDYKKECDFMEKIFEKYLDSKPKKILDLGCGTGGHLTILARRGYEITGIDASKSMIEIARNKVQKMNLDVKLYNFDIRNFCLNEKFDAVICMFAVIDYLTTNKDLQKAFLNIRRHLKKGGLFIFDFWYGPAVLTIKPSVRIKVVKKNDLKIIRMVTPKLNSLKHTLTSHYHLIALKGDRIIDEIKESHVIRFLFPQEIRHYLEENNFELLEISEFLKLNKPPTEETWNAMAIAKAI